MDDKVEISKAKLTEWAESLLHMNHHGTLIKRELPKGNGVRHIVTGTPLKLV